MKKQDWLAASVVAVVVALAVVIAGAPPNGWAENASAPAPIPRLSPGALDIPVVEAKVKAVSQRKPGEPIVVEITCESNPSHAGAVVPVTLSLMKNDWRAMMSRMGPPGPMETMMQMPLSLCLDSEGKARMSVNLPFTWAEDPPKQQAQVPVQPTTGKTAKVKRPDWFSLSLSSPLVKKSMTVASGKGNLQVAQNQQNQQ